jgi:hypothetical protein
MFRKSWVNEEERYDNDQCAEGADGNEEQKNDKNKCAEVVDKERKDTGGCAKKLIIVVIMKK